MSVEYEILELIDDRIYDQGYAKKTYVEESISDIDFDDIVTDVLEKIDLDDYIDKDNIVSDAKDEAIDYIRDDISDYVSEKVEEHIDDVREMIDDAINDYWASEPSQYIIDAVNNAIVEGSINVATPQNVDSAPSPQGNLAFLKGALVCLTRYIESLEDATLSVGEEE